MKKTKPKPTKPKCSCGKKGCSVRTIVLPHMGIRHRQISEIKEFSGLIQKFEFEVPAGVYIFRKEK